MPASQGWAMYLRRVRGERNSAEDEGQLMASAYVPPPGICECCGEPVDAVTHRHPPSGLAVGLTASIA